MMETTPVISGPARIIDVNTDNTQVTINRGSIHGIKIGQKYMLYRVTDKKLIDPDTLEDLGKLEIALGTGKVIYVQEKWATIESDMPLPPQSRVIKKTSSGYANIFGPTQEITEIPSQGLKSFEDPVAGDYAKPI